MLVVMLCCNAARHVAWRSLVQIKYLSHRTDTAAFAFKIMELSSKIIFQFFKLDMASKKLQKISFDHFTLDPADESLWRGTLRIHLRPKTFALLHHLASHPGRLVTKEELLRILWPECHVGDEALKHCVAEIRKALKDDAEKPRLIETAHRRGYRFIGQTAGHLRPAASSDWSSPDRKGRDSVGAQQLAGRTAELAELRRYLGEALSGTRQVVFVTGEQGIGKTALVDAFLSDLKRNDDRRDPVTKLLAARGQCIKSHGACEAYMPFCEAITGLSRKSRENLTITLLDQYAPLWLLQMPSLLSAAQLKTLRQRTAGATRERMLREMTEALEILTEHAPLLLVLEDLHWSDHSSLDLISYIAQRRNPARLLVIGTYRPAEVLSQPHHPLKTIKQELQVRQQCRELPLGFLNTASVSDYLRQRFPEHHFPASMPDWLQKRTAGNPLFLINMLDHMTAHGLIVQRETGWFLDISLEDAEITVPPTIQQIIQNQIEMCTPQELRLLQAGSVEGMEFSVAQLAVALAEKPDRIEVRCRKLAERGQFLQYARVSRPSAAGQSSYGFIHTLYQNAFYQMLPEELKTRLHHRVAEFLEGNSSTPAEISARLAVHFDRAGEYGRAIRYYRQAAANANSQCAGHEALELAGRGLQLLETVPDGTGRQELEMGLQIELGRALGSNRGLGAEGAYRAFSRVRELFHESRRRRGSSRKALLFSALSGLCSYYWARAECEMAREIAEQMLQLAETERNPSLLNQAHASLASIMIDIGEFTAAFQHMEKSEGRRIRCHTELVRWHLGFPDQALKNLEFILSGDWGDLKSEDYVFAHVAMAWLHLARRESESALKWSQSAMDLAIRQGLVQQWIAPMQGIHGWALARQGQTKQGFEQVSQALTAFQAVGPTNMKPLLLMIFADTSIEAGKIDEGIAAVEEALELARRTGIHSCDAEIYRLKGELLWKRVKRHRGSGQYQEIASCFDQAIGVARRQKTPFFELRATISLAKLLLEQGRISEAMHRLEKVARLITEGQNTPDMKHFRELLKKVADGKMKMKNRKGSW